MGGSHRGSPVGSQVRTPKCDRLVLANRAVGGLEHRFPVWSHNTTKEENIMLTVTQSASQHLSELLSDAPEEAVVRFVPHESGLAVQLDNVRPGDQTFEHDEKTILALDPQVSEALADRTLDVQDTEQGPQLAIS